MGPTIGLKRLGKICPTKKKKVGVRLDIQITTTHFTIWCDMCSRGILHDAWGFRNSNTRLLYVKVRELLSLCCTSIYILKTRGLGGSYPKSL